jgi:hypothetical protein
MVNAISGISLIPRPQENPRVIATKGKSLVTRVILFEANSDNKYLGNYLKTMSPLQFKQINSGLCLFCISSRRGSE